MLKRSQFTSIFHEAFSLIEGRVESYLNVYGFAKHLNVTIHLECKKLEFVSLNAIISGSSGPVWKILQCQIAHLLRKVILSLFFIQMREVVPSGGG